VTDEEEFSARSQLNWHGLAGRRLSAARTAIIHRGYIKRLRGANQYTGPAIRQYTLVMRLARLQTRRTS
jgi:hypothetical protein